MDFEKLKNIAEEEAEKIGESGMSESKHTPVPWIIEQRDGHSFGPRNVIVPEDDSLADRIAVISLNGVRDESIAEANARFIVQACNSHDALLDACRKSHEQLLEIAHKLDLPTSPQLDYIKAAIALVGKEINKNPNPRSESVRQGDGPADSEKSESEYRSQKS